MSNWKLLTAAEKIAAIREAHPRCAGTATTIAAELFELHGYQVSRNAVIGIYHRYPDSLKDVPLAGLPQAAAKPLVRTSRVKKAAPNLQKVAELHRIMDAPAPVIEKLVVPESLNLSIMDLRMNSCRWPHGEKPILFCGHPDDGQSSYCAYHHKLSVGAGTLSERNVDFLLKKVA
ncbi:GcrA family cell cycle regulator [Rhizobium leguminosarum]|uniref:GcrA family cell cycle regulator n=1 Tax=Rhizobium leguminosarum TaxID=384 RepID=UPI001039C43C|nr:GcrA family cell cycle regulator [Rhizobium leguminosarum]TBY40861.1 hypothetical protein E0H54_31730 [Rhizobium leguminosarum bv. viciae]